MVTTLETSFSLWSVSIQTDSTRILAHIAGKVPGIERIDTERSPDGRLLLRFNDRGFNDPFLCVSSV